MYCPDCEYECNTSQVDGYDTVRPWANCSLVYVGGGLERHYLDEDYAWTCNSYCTDAYGGEIPEGVTYNRAEGSSSCATFKPTVTPTAPPTFQPTLEPTTEIFEPIVNPTMEPTRDIFETTQGPTTATFDYITLEPTSESTNIIVELQDATKGGQTSNIIASIVGVSFFAVAILVLYVKKRSSYKRLGSTSLKGHQLTNKSSRNCRGAKEKNSLISQTAEGDPESNELYGAVPINVLPGDQLERNSSQNNRSAHRGMTVD